MELPSLGQQCAHPNCKQLDFLPLSCKCGKQFCSEHFNRHVGHCETFVDVQAEPQRFTNTYKCSRDDCSETGLVPMICQRCHKHFCVKHRHLTRCSDKDERTLAEEKEKIAAPIRRFNEAKTKVDKEIEEKLSEARKKGKKGNLVNKVQLMKIKNKATGLKSIPSADRVYFNVIHPGNEQGSPVFVSKEWSVGRAIDAVADECRLKNDNNKSGSKKLRLFRQEAGEIVSTNLAETLHSLITKGVVLDGDNLILEYVDLDCFNILNHN